MDELTARIRLNLTYGVGLRGYQRLLQAFGSAPAIFSASVGELVSVKGVSETLARAIRDPRGQERAEREIARARSRGIRLLTVGEDGYPPGLAEIYDPPLILYVRGEILREDQRAVAIVGSRRSSAYGRHQAERLACALAEREVTVISGLARGIDSAAHRGALRGGGRTIAVLGSGLLEIYPPENAELAADIADRGAVISEFSLDTPPRPGHFPRRNRLLSGLSLGVLVMEATDHSGSLITADWALQQGRSVLALPGCVGTPTSRGTLRLLKEGARLVEDVGDILEELGLEDPLASTGAQLPQGLSGPEATLLDLVPAGDPRPLEEILDEADISAAAALRTLTSLEVRKFVRRYAGQRYARV